MLADELLVLEYGRVLQSGTTEAVFRRPASETVARLLGAETIAAGIAVGERQIAIGDGIVLDIAGPALHKGRRVGWSGPPGHVRIGNDGRYEACVESVIAGGIACRIALRRGGACIEACETGIDRANRSPCRVDINPYAIRVWPKD